MGFLDNARDKQTNKFLDEVVEHLLPGENVIAQSIGVGSKRSGKTFSGGLALTENRLIFIGRALTEKLVDSHPLDTTTGITTTHGAIVGELGIKNGLSFEEYKIPRKAMDDFVSTIRRVADSRRGSTDATPAAPASTSVSDELVKLAGLYAQGILSDDEFAAAKSRLIGGL